MSLTSLIYPLLLSALLILVQSQSPSTSFGSLTSLCLQVIALDCAKNYLPEGDETLCGTDGVTYINFCVYAQRRCQDGSLTMKHFGPCLSVSGDTNDTSSTTQSPHTKSLPPHSSTTIVPSTTTHDLIVQVFCSQESTNFCPTNLDPVCGTNYQFYRNECHFAKAKCKDSTLDLQVLENCKTLTPLNVSSGS